MFFFFSLHCFIMCVCVCVCDQSIRWLQTTRKKKNKKNFPLNEHTHFLSCWPIIRIWCLLLFFVFSEYCHLSQNLTLILMWRPTRRKKMTHVENNLLTIDLTLKIKIRKKKKKNYSLKPVEYLKSYWTFRMSQACERVCVCERTRPPVDYLFKESCHEEYFFILLYIHVLVKFNCIRFYMSMCFVWRIIGYLFR